LTSTSWRSPATPENRRLDDGTALCKLRIANNDRTKHLNGDWINRPQFFNVTIWAAIGEWVAEHLHKGDKVVLSGRLKWSEWDTVDGKRQAIETLADSIIQPHRRRRRHRILGTAARPNTAGRPAHPHHSARTQRPWDPVLRQAVAELSAPPEDSTAADTEEWGRHGDRAD
jgi:single stranded DNA-binding protein